MQGTREFASINLLEFQEPGRHEYTRDYLDDLESFLLVFGYAVKRHSIASAPERERAKLHEEFSKSYGRLNIDDLYRERRGMAALHMVSYTHGVSPRMQEWFRTLSLRGGSELGHTFDYGFDMTHSKLIALLDDALAYLEQP